MNIFINILVPFICILIGYIFGSFQTSIIIGERVFHVDIRTLGSKNAGATNVGRLWGKKWRIIVTTIDVAKTVLPIILCWAILSFVTYNGKTLMPWPEQFYSGNVDGYLIKWPVYYLAGTGVILGHCYPAFNEFRGGKGAASFLTSAALTSWMFGLLALFGYEIWKKTTKIVSKSMLLNGLIFVLLDWIFTILFYLEIIPRELFWLPSYHPCFTMVPLFHPLMMTVNYLIMVIRHKDNIKRLISGNENVIKQGS